MGREYPYHHAYIEHGDQRSYANHFPTPLSKEDKHEEGSDAHQRAVGAYLHFAEVAVQKFGNCQGQPFTREHQRVATHFAGDAESQYGPADEQLDKSQRIPYQRVDVERYLQKTREPHRQVGIEAEEEGNQNLGVLPFLEILAQEQHLYGDEKHMHADGQLAHGEIDTRHQRQNIGRSRDGR